MTRAQHPRRSLRLARVVALLVVVAAGCSVPKDDEARAIDPARLVASTSDKRNCTSAGVDDEPVKVRVYLVSTEEPQPTVSPVERVLPAGDNSPGAALDALFTCRVTSEESRDGLATAIPEETKLLGFVYLEGTDGLFEVRLGPLRTRGAKQVDDLDKLAVAQIFFTTQGLTPEVKGLRFSIDGRAKAVSTDQRTVGQNDFVRRGDFKSSSPPASTETQTTVTRGTDIVGAPTTTR